MPLPKPRRGEKQSDFVSRCIDFEMNASPGTPKNQVQAMCYNAWRNRGESAEAQNPAITKLYRNAGLTPPKGRGLHTMEFHKCVVGYAKKIKSGEITQQEAYKRCMGALGPKVAVNPSHQRSSSEIKPDLSEIEVKEGYTSFPCEISFTEAVFDATADHPIIKNITVLGSESKNKRRYLRAAMEGAVSLYDNVKVFVNHQQEEGGLFGGGGPDVMKLAGKLTAPVFDAGALKIRADFHGLPDDTVAEKVTKIAQHMPEIAGFSHNAKGKIRVEDGIEIVEEIQSVYSVDLVAYPATNRGMFEHSEQKEIEMKWDEIRLEDLRKHRADIITDLQQEGSKSRDDEVQQLIQEKSELAKELDVLKVEKTLAEKRTQIDAWLNESELPKEARTELFRETLLKLEPGQNETLEALVKAHIDDRMKAIGSKVVKHNTERKIDEHESDKGKKSDEEIIADIKS